MQYIGGITRDYKMAEEYAAKADSVIEKTTQSNPIYEDLYKDQAQDRLLETKKRLQGQDIGFSVLKIKRVLNT